jgi:Domain of unknown function (DUF202)
MIKRYSDHAANERTFLAWVRTATAVMAFGFLVERFDLFIRFATKEFASSLASPWWRSPAIDFSGQREPRKRSGDLLFPEVWIQMASARSAVQNLIRPRWTV